MGYLVIEVTGTKDDEHLEIVSLHVVEHLIFQDHLFLHTFGQVVIDEFGGDALNRFFAGRVDLRQYHLVELAQGIGEILVEVAGAGIEVWLEDRCNMLVLIEFTNALGTLIYLFRVVGIVAEEDQTCRS